MAFLTPFSQLLDGFGPGEGTPPAPSAVAVSTLCDVWAQDVILVTFSQSLVNDAALKDPANFTVTARDGGIPVTVRQVQSTNLDHTPHIWLVISTPQSGKTYQIACANLFTLDGSPAAVGPCRFIGRDTKEDSIIKSRPSMYDMRPDSVLRILLQAIGRQDDLIGGARSDYFTAPLPPPITVDVEPKNVSVAAGFNKEQFTATVHNTADQDVLWYVDDILGGDFTVGTISDSGQYASPFSVPTPATVTIKAVSVADPSAFDTTTVTIT